MEEVEHITSAARYRSHTAYGSSHSPQLAWANIIIINNNKFYIFLLIL